MYTKGINEKDKIAELKEEIIKFTTTRYYYDGPFSVVLRRMNWRALAETDTDDTTQREYVYGNYLDEVLVMVDVSEDDHYYAHDHLFSVVALLDDTGAVEEYYEYDAYGNVVVHTDDGADDTWLTGDDSTDSVSAQGNPYTFTGQRLDSLDNNSLSVMYYKNRYYDTDTGRFLQHDPIGVNDSICLVNFRRTGSPVFPRQLRADKQYIDGMSLYEYVRSDPVFLYDSQGLMWFPQPEPRKCSLPERAYWNRLEGTDINEKHLLGSELLEHVKVNTFVKQKIHQLKIEAKQAMVQAGKTMSCPQSTGTWGDISKGWGAIPSEGIPLIAPIAEDSDLGLSMHQFYFNYSISCTFGKGCCNPPDCLHLPIAPCGRMGGYCLLWLRVTDIHDFHGIYKPLSLIGDDYEIDLRWSVYFPLPIVTVCPD